ncbi:DegT/DnrJ/EryC1/StrS family aminotransferase [Desulfobacca acetoxidans]
MDTIPVSGPWITQKEIEYVTDAVSNAWYSKANMYNQKFEEKFAEYLGVRFAISLPSCTSAIHLSLLALGVGPEDEVVVPDVTWIASAAPITYVGAIPVFADIDPQSWCLSATSLEECITSRTKAILPVDLYGNVPDMDAIDRIAKSHGITVIEDAAEAIGSEYRGKKAGVFGDTGVFSFHGSKTLTTGEGGMLVTNREDIYRRALFLRDHGRLPGDKMFYNTEVAYKYKMSSMQAALGLAQLERIDELVNRKREIFKWYGEELSEVDVISLNHEEPGTKNTYWMVSAIVDEGLGIKKEDLMELMSGRKIDCRPFFHPLSSLPAYKDFPGSSIARERNKISYQISPYGINLPSGMNMTVEKVQYVCSALRAILSS